MRSRKRRVWVAAQKNCSHRSSLDSSRKQRRCTVKMRRMFGSLLSDSRDTDSTRDMQLAMARLRVALHSSNVTIPKSFTRLSLTFIPKRDGISLLLELTSFESFLLISINQAMDLQEETMTIQFALDSEESKEL